MGVMNILIFYLMWWCFTRSRNNTILNTLHSFTWVDTLFSSLHMKKKLWKELCSDLNTIMVVISFYVFTWNDRVSLALGRTLFSNVGVSSLWSMLLAAVCKGKKSSQWNLSHHIPIFWSVQSISKYWFTWTNGFLYVLQIVPRVLP